MDCVTRPAENTPKGHGSTSLHLAAIHQIFGFNGLIPSLHEYRSLGYFSPRARFIINPYTRIPASVLRQFENRGIEDRYELKPPREFWIRGIKSMMHLNSLLRKERREKKEKENLLEFSTSKDATMIRVFEEISWPSGKEKNLIFLF